MYTFLKISHVVCLQFQARAGSPSLYVSFSYIIFRGKLERKICLHIQYIDIFLTMTQVCILIPSLWSCSYSGLECQNKKGKKKNPSVCLALACCI